MKPVAKRRRKPSAAILWRELPRADRAVVIETLRVDALEFEHTARNARRDPGWFSADGDERERARALRIAIRVLRQQAVAPRRRRS